MGKTVLYGLPAIMLVFCFMGCIPDPTDSNFVAVTDISLSDGYVALGSSLTLNGIVEPSDATNKTIKWELTPGLAEGTGGVIDSSRLTVENFGALGTDWGQVGVTAAIANGKGEGIPFTKNFSIAIDSYNADTKTLYFLAQKGDGTGTWQHWNGSDRNLNVTRFYKDPLEPNTLYEITIRGTLDTAVTELSVDFYCWDEVDENVYFGQRATVKNVAAGAVNEVLYYQTKGDAEFQAEYSKTADELIAEYGESFMVSFLTFDGNDIADSDYGKIKAKINDLDITVKKVTE